MTDYLDISSDREAFRMFARDLRAAPSEPARATVRDMARKRLDLIASSTLIEMHNDAAAVSTAVLQVLMLRGPAR